MQETTLAGARFFPGAKAPVAGNKPKPVTGLAASHTGKRRSGMETAVNTNLKKPRPFGGALPRAAGTGKAGAPPFPKP